MTEKRPGHSQRLLLVPPKRPLTPFFLFKADVFHEVKEKNPNSKMTELTQIIDYMWREADEATRIKYHKLGMEAKSRYEKELAEFNGKIVRKNKKSKEEDDAIPKKKVKKNDTEDKKIVNFDCKVKGSKWTIEVREGSVSLELLAEGFDKPKSKEISISDFF